MLSFFIYLLLANIHSHWLLGSAPHNYPFTHSSSPPLGSLQMKFFSWMHNKFNAAQGNNNNSNNVIRKSNPSSSATYINTNQEPRNEEFSDWPHGLLAIGTFGNNEIKGKLADQATQNTQEEEVEVEEQPTSPDLTEFTPEEVGKLQKELTKLLRRKPKVIEGGGEINSADLPLDKFLNCPSSLEVDRRLSTALCSDLAVDKEEDIERTIRVILGRCKDVCKQNKNKSISKKSVSFLLKKMFVCSSGFAPAPSLRDPLPESRMEKLLRAIISKKMYPPQTSRASSTKKLIEDRSISKSRKDKANDGCKWVKTDSEFIVLEI